MQNDLLFQYSLKDEIRHRPCQGGCSSYISRITDADQKAFLNAIKRDIIYCICLAVCVNFEQNVVSVLQQLLALSAQNKDQTCF